MPKNLIEMLESKRALIFDFDGVLVDSVEVKTEAFAQLYSSYGPDVVDLVVNHHRQHGGMSRFEKFRHYHAAFLNKVITDEEVSELALQFSKLVTDRVVAAPAIDGAVAFLESNYSTKKCFVNSATPENEIHEIIRRRKWDRYFEGVFGAPESKIANLDKIVSTFGLNLSEVVFFGDAISDYEAAAYKEIDFVAVGDNENLMTIAQMENIWNIKSFIELQNASIKPGI